MIWTSSYRLRQSLSQLNIRLSYVCGSIIWTIFRTPWLWRGKRGWLINSARALNCSFIKKQVMSQGGGVCFFSLTSLESLLSGVACVCITRALVNTKELSHLHITGLYRLQKEARRWINLSRSACSTTAVFFRERRMAAGEKKGAAAYPLEKHQLNWSRTQVRERAKAHRHHVFYALRRPSSARWLRIANTLALHANAIHSRLCN